MPTSSTTCNAKKKKKVFGSELFNETESAKRCSRPTNQINTTVGTSGIREGDGCHISISRIPDILDRQKY
jgi:hypothetical protein